MHSLALNAQERFLTVGCYPGFPFCFVPSEHLYAALLETQGIQERQRIIGECFHMCARSIFRGALSYGSADDCQETFQRQCAC